MVRELFLATSPIEVNFTFQQINAPFRAELTLICHSGLLPKWQKLNRNVEKRERENERKNWEIATYLPPIKWCFGIRKFTFISYKRLRDRAKIHTILERETQ
ncbi:hypothetical protein TorRG33x02_283700 [Trema orientale]|uniref:Uncharacterized protein n=1 Tax=Trema orientale TaxID=63057 RepID=A0A2P5CIC5_TREOI|nr:hypothetical protein TorRG33x02_283700 [Trema orientale]